MTDLINVIIFEDTAKQKQYRFTVSEFLGTNYLSIREWYKDYDGNFAASNNGVTLPYLLHTCSGLFNALSVTLSKAETLDKVSLDQEFLADLYKQAELYTKLSNLICLDNITITKIDETTVEIKCL